MKMERWATGKLCNWSLTNTETRLLNRGLVVWKVKWESRDLQCFSSAQTLKIIVAWFDTAQIDNFAGWAHAWRTSEPKDVFYVFRCWYTDIIMFISEIYAHALSRPASILVFCVCFLLCRTVSFLCDTHCVKDKCLRVFNNPIGDGLGLIG